MEWVVTTGRTLEDAKEAALDELGVDEADAEFEILEEPRQGLFGRQRGEARVRARVRPTSPRPKVERRDRKRKSADGKGAPDEVVAGAGAKPAPRKRSGRGTGAATAVTTDGSTGAPVGTRGPAAGPDGAPERPVKPRRSRVPRAKAPTDNAPDGEDERETMSDQTMTLAEQGEAARQFLSGLMAEFGLATSTDVNEVDEDTIEVRVTGSELGLLIGPKGQTLAAVQELTRTVVQRRTPGRTGRLMVDVAGYRQRRREALERFTQQVAADVVASKVQKVLEPMSAADRKVVHDTANEIDGVRTTSEGEEPRRFVVIIPDGSAAG
jgi:spoIIIJ-associated protein